MSSTFVSPAILRRIVYSICILVAGQLSTRVDAIITHSLHIVITYSNLIVYKATSKSGCNIVQIVFMFRMHAE